MLMHTFPINGIAVVGHGRTGSTWLHSLLSSYPNANAFWGEIFQTGFAYDEWKQKKKTPFEFLRTRLTPGRVLVFKYMYPAIERFNLFDDFKNLNIKTVHIYRSNFIDVFTSMHINKHRLSPHTATFAINKNQFTNFLTGYANINAKIRELAPNSIIIKYEDIVHDQKATLYKLQTQLGLVPHDLESPMKKKLKRPLTDVISNYNEIKSLINKKYEI